MAEPIRLTDLPFELDVALADSLAAATLDVTLTASTEADVDAESLLQSGEMVELLPRAANLQLLGIDGAPGSARAGMQLMDKRVSADHRLWHYRLSAQQVSPASLALLVALLTQTAYAGAPLGRVSLRCGPGTAARDAAWLIEQAQRGPVRAGAAWPFAVTWGNPARKQRRITVEFRDDVDAARAQRFEEAVNLWDHLVTFGAFQLDFTEQEGFDPSMGSFAYPEPKLIEHLIWVEGNDEAAYTSLLHLLAQLHALGDAIASVQLE